MHCIYLSDRYWPTYSAALYQLSEYRLNLVLVHPYLEKFSHKLAMCYIFKKPYIIFCAQLMFTALEAKPT